MYFWSLGISLYLELFCFLSFITIVLRNLCSGTHRRNRDSGITLFRRYKLQRASVCILRVKFEAVFEAGLKADRAILSYIFFQYYGVRSDDVILLKSR